MKFIAVFTLALVLVGCSPQQYRAAVTNQFTNALVVPNTHCNSSFLIRKADGSVWEINCGNPFTTSITSEYQIFPPTK